MKRTSICKPEDRQAVLNQGRKLKMARSADAYVRGNTFQFYEWLLEAMRRVRWARQSEIY